LKKDPFQNQAPSPVKHQEQPPITVQIGEKMKCLMNALGSLEKCWWENGTAKPFSPNLITLAEKLGFNIERFLKITGPSNSG
jgi:hypothetical protein